MVGNPTPQPQPACFSAPCGTVHTARSAGGRGTPLGTIINGHVVSVMNTCCACKSTDLFRWFITGFVCANKRVGTRKQIRGIFYTRLRGIWCIRTGISQFATVTTLVTNGLRARARPTAHGVLAVGLYRLHEWPSNRHLQGVRSISWLFGYSPAFLFGQ